MSLASVFADSSRDQTAHKAAVLEMFDAAGGIVATNRATALITALWRGRALAVGTDSTAAVGLIAADRWSRALYLVAQEGWIRRSQGDLVLTLAGEEAVRSLSAQAGGPAQRALAELAGLSVGDLRSRAATREP